MTLCTVTDCWLEPGDDGLCGEHRDDINFVYTTSSIPTEARRGDEWRTPRRQREDAAQLELHRERIADR